MLRKESNLKQTTNTPHTLCDRRDASDEKSLRESVKEKPYASIFY
jgi:hypothetical protein